MEQATVNLRSKRTESENSAVIALWNSRRDKVSVRKKYEDEIEKDNQKLAKEIKTLLAPVITVLDAPIELIIESHRSVVQMRVYSSPKARGQQFVTTLSHSIGPIEGYMSDQKKLLTLRTDVKTAVRRMKALIKKNLGVIICPNNRPPMGRIQDLKRQPTDPMLVVTYNVRTRYDF